MSPAARRPYLVGDAATRGPLAGVLADRAYDSRGMWQRARRAGGRLVCIPKNRAVRGRDPDRDVALDQIGRIGEPAWRERSGYGDRSHVEGGFSALKRTTGDRALARSMAGITGEVIARVMLYNTWRARELVGAG